MRTTLAFITSLALTAPTLAVSSTVTNQAPQKTTVFTVIAQSDSSNSGLNFNGASQGGKTFTVPLGWTVRIQYKNAGPMPHSLVVVPAGAPVLSYDQAAAAFKGAASPDPVKGVVKQATLTFKASKAGKYLLICGVPGHGMGGQYINLEVSPAAKAASFK
ncbi:sulfocyanin-like copper-binding protein [Deinococcus navajonensis]|uniref:Sulfocyanin-like copper-binding protein n=1 Tax=Deinococcus navajonensis TaxID=309884 RepID=A0ABV8XQ14_9DEIO